MTTRLDYVNRGDISGLFREELGWNRPDITKPVKIDVDEKTYEARQVAGYKGIRVWQVATIPDTRTQRFIDAELRRVSDERLIVFTDKKIQKWRWPQVGNTQGSGQPRLVTHNHAVGTENAALDQRLAMIEIGFSESPTVPEILRRMRAAFDADRITNEFYKKFLTQHDALVTAIEGLDVEGDRKWYSALLMNRLMFIYFMQRKGFMDNDRDYLRTRLTRLRSQSGNGKFYEFYRDFLLPMFHDGLGALGLQAADPLIKDLIGDIPYINGGIFAVHELEAAHQDIRIPDEIFEAIFNLFDSYQWHLDERPTANQNEINPDVLGYIFEQFINQKETGAYYTKDDVTHFMTTSTLLPVFLERLQAKTGINPWDYVAKKPDTYVWDSLTHGIEEPLPTDIEAQRNAFPRPVWNERASGAHGLPGETWWEVDQRRSNLSTLIKRAKSGAINDVNSATTNNIDFETLALAVIDGIDNPADVVATWRILTGLKVIDPTCGSGAFLFAALKILFDLYDAVLDAARAQAVTSSDLALHALLAKVDDHANQNYFILKHATLNNIYGVDLMKEATEIARLRLFLKLVSAIDDRRALEPLPDLDFNIKAGNVLVGARTVDEIRDTSDLFAEQTVEDVLTKSTKVSASYKDFRNIQECGDASDVKAARETLAARLTEVRNLVNEHYHSVQGIRFSLKKWVDTHAPFHWFIEYPEVFADGGFDVLIGNPPYVTKSKVKRYEFSGFDTSDAPDIYAPCTERASQITRADGRMTLIIPISSQFSKDYTDLRKVLNERFTHLWVSTFDRRPSGLFSGKVGVRSTIIVGSGAGRTKSLYVTNTHRWVKEYRPALFETLQYTDASGSILSKDSWMRLPTTDIRVYFETLVKQNPLQLNRAFAKHGRWRFGFKGNALYWLSAFIDAPPVYLPDGTQVEQTMMKWVSMRTRKEQLATLAVTLSKTSLAWWHLTGDNLNVTLGTIGSIPVDINRLSPDVFEELASLGEALEAALPSTSRSVIYRQRRVFNYYVPTIRHLTDRVDDLIARDAGHVDILPALEHTYWTIFKGTGDEADEAE